MKKYIRTKDELYDTENLMYRTIKDNKVYQVGWDVEKPTFEADILAEANTIEELCDRFIAETEDTTKFWVEPTLENAKMYCGIKNIYGAIWTDKGLIFVAKMDENGELVLI